METLQGTEDSGCMSNVIVVKGRGEEFACLQAVLVLNIRERMKELQVVLHNESVIRMKALSVLQDERGMSVTG